MRKLAIILVAMVLSVPASAYQQTTVTLDSERRQDIYAVYSAAFGNLDSRDSVNLRDGVYLIDAKTVPLQPQSPSSPPNVLSLLRCFDIPQAYAPAWSEIQAELGMRKDSPGTIERVLKIQTPYVLLNVDEVREFQDALRRGFPAQNPKFQGGRSLITLGDVYFNQKRTLALTVIGIACGSLCGSGRNLIFEKDSNGRWEARPNWAPCAFAS
jgi:hypothetical protein